MAQSQGVDDESDIVGSVAEYLYMKMLERR
jgi:hypothetical protein